MSRFRTLEVSDPALERDHLRFVTCKSPALGGRGDFCLMVPPGIELARDLPLVLLLHGVYGSHWAWSLKGAAHLTAQAMMAAGEIPPMILAMPSDGLTGDGSGYLPRQKIDYERWIMEDVVLAAGEIVPQLSPRSPLYLSGLSMGGFGAMRLGTRHAARVAGISAHSSITHLNQFDRFVEEPLSSFGTPPDPCLETLLLQAGASLPPLRFDCGRQDPLIEHNRSLHQVLSQKGVPHEYEEFEGGHSWDYWREHLKDGLRFFARLQREGAGK